MVNHTILQYLIVVLSYSLLIFATHNKSNETQIAVYWGQNVIEKAKKKDDEHIIHPKLKEVCNDKAIDIVIICFVDKFPIKPSDDNKSFLQNSLSILRNGFSYDYEYSSKILFEELETCKSNNKTVLLSLGGEEGNYGQFKNVQQVENFIDELFEIFGNNTDKLIDGIDLDIENINIENDNDKNENYFVNDKTMVYYIELINKFKFKFGSDFLISLSPQCHWEGEIMKQIILNDTIVIDYMFIQFYNNPECNANNVDGFNFDFWKSKTNNHTKLFMGIPGDGSRMGAENGYVDDVNVLDDLISVIKNDSRFGGVSVWDVSLGVNNFMEKTGANYIETIKSILDENYETGQDNYDDGCEDEGDEEENSTKSSGKSVMQYLNRKMLSFELLLSLHYF